MIGILKTEIKNIDRDYFAIDNLNKLTYTTTNNALFCNEVHPKFPLYINTNMLQRVSAHSFSGILITDELNLAQDLINITYAKKKFLYLYILEWMYIQNPQFSFFKSALLNENIELIARTQKHFQIIQKLFKTPKYIMSEWDYKTLIEIDTNE